MAAQQSEIVRYEPDSPEGELLRIDEDARLAFKLKQVQKQGCKSSEGMIDINGTFTSVSEYD